MPQQTSKRDCPEHCLECSRGCSAFLVRSGRQSCVITPVRVPVRAPCRPPAAAKPPPQFCSARSVPPPPLARSTGLAPSLRKPGAGDPPPAGCAANHGSQPRQPAAAAGSGSRKRPRLSRNADGGRRRAVAPQQRWLARSSKGRPVGGARALGQEYPAEGSGSPRI